MNYLLLESEWVKFKDYWEYKPLEDQIRGITEDGNFLSMVHKF